LYRVVYEKRPEIEYADLSKLDHSKLIDLLVHPNIFYRQRASVILAEHLLSRDDDEAKQTVAAMISRLLSRPTPESIQLLTTTLSLRQVASDRICQIAEHYKDQPDAFAWCVRSIGERSRAGDSAGSTESCKRLLTTAASSDDPRVRLQAAIAAGKLSPDHAAILSPTKILIDVLQGSIDDGLLPRIVWQNLKGRIAADQSMIVQRLANASDADALLVAMAPRIATRLLADVKPDLSAPSDAATLASVLAIADSLAGRNGQAEGEVLRSVLAKLRTGEIRAASARESLNKWLSKTKSTGDYRVQLSAFAGDASAIGQVAATLVDRGRPAEQRREALETIAITNPSSMQAAVSQWIADLEENAKVDDGWRDALLNAVLRFGDAETQRKILAQLTRLPIGVRTMVAGRMIQRDDTAKLLLAEISSGGLAKDMLGPDQIKHLASSPAADIQASVKKIWGSVRMKDSANRQAVVREMSEYLLKDAHGDATKGWVVYDRICGQCHKMHGRGYEVGPEITRNGRGSFDQLIVSVFDPSLVIGEAYKSVSVLTADGRLISGLVTERSDQRIVLKVQGGKLEVIPMDEADEIRDNDQSLMPEGLETQMTRQEMADLFALLSLDQSPETAGSQVIAGTPEGLHAKP
jgi:putative heme-binding domain-containing protein